MKRKFPTSISKILQENPSKKYLGLGPKNKPSTPASVCTRKHVQKAREKKYCLKVKTLYRNVKKCIKSLEKGIL